MLVAALVLVIGSCGLADPITKSRTDSMRGASWPGADAEQAALGSAAVVHTGTPSPTATPSPFRGAFEPPDGTEGPDGEPSVRESGRTFWPAPTPDEPYEELDHSPEPDPDPDPCDAVGVLPDECDPEPDPTPCDESAGGCAPTNCEEPDADGCDPPDCDGGPTSGPTESPDPGESPDPTGTPGPSQTPKPSQTPEPTASPSPSEPPDGGEPGC